MLEAALLHCIGLEKRELKSVFEQTDWVSEKIHKIVFVPLASQSRLIREIHSGPVRPRTVLRHS